jgi:hypothetical protein
VSPYDPKRRRAHSPTVEEGHAPVDDLLAAPSASPSATPAPAPTAVPAPVPATEGPDPRVIALAAGAAVAAFLVWRWRRR